MLVENDGILIDDRIKRMINKIPISHRINYCLEMAKQNIEELNRQGVLSREKIAGNLQEWVSTLKLTSVIPAGNVKINGK